MIFHPPENDTFLFGCEHAYMYGCEGTYPLLHLLMLLGLKTPVSQVMQNQPVPWGNNHLGSVIPTNPRKKK